MKNVRLLVVLLAGAALAQQVSKIDAGVPQAVQDLIHQAINGTEKTSIIGFDRIKVRMGFDSSTRISDVKAGAPIRCYWLSQDSLMKAHDHTPVSALVVALIGQYEVPLLAKGRIICFLDIVKDKTFGEKWHLRGESSGGLYAREWQKVIKTWPKSAGFNPVLVEAPFLGKRFFHIPEKGDDNLTCLQGTANDTGEIMTDSLYSNLTQSKDTYKSLEREVHNSRSYGGLLK
jgi:hypothetical protein